MGDVDALRDVIGIGSRDIGMVALEERPPRDLDRLGAAIDGELEARVEIVARQHRAGWHVAVNRTGARAGRAGTSPSPRMSASTSWMDRVARSPVARSVTSRPPAARERGETVRIQGIPSSSASVNLTPGDSSRSS
jgi:hypothetical protein